MKAVSKLSVLSVVLFIGVAAYGVFSPRDLAHAQQPTQPPKQQKPKEDDQEQVLKVGTRLVNVLFSVTDKQNRYIDDLKQDELQVFENGQQQNIFTFKKEFDLPLTLAIMVDVSGSERYVLPQLKDAGVHFVESVQRFAPYV